MPSGYSTTQNLADSKDVVVAQARIVGEHKGVVRNLFEVQKLAHGTGDAWKEIALAQLTAMAINETELIENYQQLSDSALTITPTYSGIATLITDPVADRISPKTMAQIGTLGGNAMVRKEERDCITMLDGFSNSIPGTGQTLTSFHISHAADRIRAYATEPGEDPLYFVGHAYQMTDLADELKAGIGTYPIPEGETLRVLRQAFRGPINGVQCFEANQIQVVSSDAKGAVWAKKALIRVTEEIATYAVQRREDIGIGANIVFLRASYGLGERVDGWGVEICSDASTPA